ncbi:MAG: DUF2029 domain-containing protein [Pseudobutyrivibrio ruminis]|nr:DUF2029 domain-containing protein [Pseudobutyrivibrio ruminis]
MQVIRYIKNNYMNIIMFICLYVLGLIFFFELVEGNNRFATNQVVNDYDKMRKITYHDLEYSNGVYTIIGSNSYLIIPNTEKYNRVTLEVKGDLAGSQMYIRVWNKAKEKWSIENSLSQRINAEKESYTFDFAYDNTGCIKISILGCNGQQISLGKVTFSLNHFTLSFFSVIRLTLFAGVFAIISGYVLYRLYRYADKLGLFWGIVASGIAVFLLINLSTNSYYLTEYLYSGGTYNNYGDSFMDYFNMLALMSNDDPYYLDASYPPLCFVILKLLHLFLPKGLQSVYQGWILRETTIAVVWFLVLFVGLIAIACYLIKSILGEKQRSIYAIVFVLSGPMLYLIQRGNLLIIAFVFSLIYFKYYNSESKKYRYIAYIALAISASIKIYPALLGFMTLRTKRYKETIHLAIIGAIIFFLPFWAFDGVDTMNALLHGLRVVSDEMTNNGLGQNFSLVNLFAILSAYLGLEINVSQVFLILIMISLILGAIFSKKEWHSWFLLVTAFVWYPAFSFTYVLVFYFLPALALLRKDYDYRDKIDISLLAMLQIPYALPYMYWMDNKVNNESMRVMSYGTLVPNLIIVWLTLNILLGIICFYISKEKNSLYIDIKAKKVSASIFLLAIISIGIVTLNSTYSEDYDFSGKGTRINPYKISSTEEFVDFLNAVNDGEDFKGAYFVQTCDLDFGEYESFSPIGNIETGCEFAGIYDGKGYSIDNYSVVSNNTSGVWGELSGEIRNVQINNCVVSGMNVGTIAYSVGQEGKISNCIFNGIACGYHVGAISAYCSGTIENTLSFIGVEGIDEGHIYSDNIATIYSTASVINSYSNLSSGNGELINFEGTELDELNKHVRICNSIWNKEFVMKSWTIKDGLFCLE